MKLNKKDRDILIRDLKSKLLCLSDNCKIKLDKDLLEELLFTEKVVNKDGKTVKIPAWHNRILRVIDLSEVNFDNVSWSILGTRISKSTAEALGIDQEFVPSIEAIVKENSGSIVDYSNTNANIDLTKSYEAINFGGVTIRNCDFSFVNFASQDLSKLRYFDIADSSIAFSGLKIPHNINLRGERTNFLELDMTAFKIDGNKYLLGDPENLFGCYLESTGINIEFDTQKYKRIISSGDAQKRNDVSDRVKQAIKYNWGGCYLNGKRIKRADEIETSKKSKQIEYQQMVDNMMFTVGKSVDAQVKEFKKNI